MAVILNIDALYLWVIRLACSPAQYKPKIAFRTISELELSILSRDAHI